MTPEPIRPAECVACPECGCPYDWRASIGVASAERALLWLAQAMLHDVIEGDDVPLWKIEELASDIGDAMARSGAKGGGSEKAPPPGQGALQPPAHPRIGGSSDLSEGGTR